MQSSSLENGPEPLLNSLTTLQPDNSDADPVSEEKVMKFCVILQDYMKKCETQGKYEEAQKAHTQLTKIRTEEGKRKFEALKLAQSKEKKQLLEQQRSQMEKFESTWRKYLKSYDELACQYVDQLQNKHAKELLDKRNEKIQIDKKAEESTTMRFSKNLLEWRRRQDLLAKVKNYGEAQKVKVIADRIEEQERLRHAELHKSTKNNHEKAIVLQQKNEMHALKKKIYTRRKEHEIQRRTDSETLFKRNKNALSVMNQKHRLDLKHKEIELNSFIKHTAPKPGGNRLELYKD